MCACRPTWTFAVYAFSTQKGLISDRSPLTHVKRGKFREKIEKSEAWQPHTQETFFFFKVSSDMLRAKHAQNELD